jgi:hypothetical protein
MLIIIKITSCTVQFNFCPPFHATLLFPPRAVRLQRHWECYYRRDSLLIHSLTWKKWNEHTLGGDVTLMISLAYASPAVLVMELLLLSFTTLHFLTSPLPPDMSKATQITGNGIDVRFLPVKEKQNRIAWHARAFHVANYSVMMREWRLSS